MHVLDGFLLVVLFVLKTSSSTLFFLSFQPRGEIKKNVPRDDENRLHAVYLRERERESGDSRSVSGREKRKTPTWNDFQAVWPKFEVEHRYLAAHRDPDRQVGCGIKPLPPS